MDVSPLKKALSDLKKQAKKEVNKELKGSADRIVSQAKAAVGIPSIAATIRASKAGNGYQVTAGQGLSDPEIAAYHEFGTGDFARALVSTLPGDWQIYARTFYKNGMGRLPARPYLYPAFYNELRYYMELKTL